MKIVLPTITHEDQTSFLKDLYIGENITLFLDVQEHLAREARSCMCFLADRQKAYDLMDRGFIEASLLAFGFGPFFVKWFQTLHFETFSRPTINAFLTDPFPVLSGVRQGCPWAPFLYLCSIEHLACALRNSKLESIPLPDGRKLIYSGYADDTTLFLDDHEDLDSAVRNFDCFSNVSDMKLNHGKCSTVPFGIFKVADPPLNCPFSWLSDSSEMEKLLGVSVGIDFDEDVLLKELLSKLSDLVKHWAAQKLSVFGRIHAARSYIGGKAFLPQWILPIQKDLGNSLRCSGLMFKTTLLLMLLKVMSTIHHGRGNFLSSKSPLVVLMRKIQRPF
jgi:hypothetical protein